MDKKELKLYVTPAVEVIETELEVQLLAGSTNANGVNVDPIEGAGDLVETDEP
jgi:hypothetical protein